MNHNKQTSESVLATILSDESFWPSEPNSLAETGLPVSVVEALTCKRLSVVGNSSGRQLAQHLCLPFQLLSAVLMSLRERQIIVHTGSAPFNDYVYSLTETGRARAQAAMKACAYVGPAPVPIDDYILSAEAQTIRAESPRREDLLAAFRDISVNTDMFDSLGPAINSGAGLFLYGEPGNGKSTLARRITKCFGQQIWIPRTIIEDGQIIKLFDPSLHRAAQGEEDNVLSSSSFDRRWIKIDRPTVVVGGELTMDALEIRHDPVSNVSEAPLQMKSNCGCFLIDDFGRQRIEPRELLNRWIVPLESRIDFLTLSTGKKIQVPFEQLIIFSTNLEPKDLVDEAFLRRIPYKVHVCDPDVDEFHQLFEIYAGEFSCSFRPDVVDHLIENHYKRQGRPMRRCHPRDLLSQIKNYCSYNDLEMEMRDQYFDHVIKSYFAVVINQPTTNLAPSAPEPRTKPVGEAANPAAAVKQSANAGGQQPAATPRPPAVEPNRRSKAIPQASPEAAPKQPVEKQPPQHRQTSQTQQAVPVQRPPLRIQSSTLQASSALPANVVAKQPAKSSPPGQPAAPASPQGQMKARGEQKLREMGPPPATRRQTRRENP